MKKYFNKKSNEKLKLKFLGFEIEVNEPSEKMIKILVIILTFLYIFFKI